MYFPLMILFGGLVCADYSGLVMTGPVEEFTVKRDDRPQPVCDGNMIGVGIDLSTTYGTVAIKYPNQTVVDVGRIDSYARSPYTQLIQSFYGHRVPDNAILPPGSAPFWPELWLLSSLRRKRRKALGLPSTSGVAQLSSILKRLYNLAQASTDQPLPENVLVSTPYLLNMGPQDLDDALEHIGLTNLHNPSINAKAPDFGSDELSNVAISQAAASYAGLGLGLCEHWQDFEKCKGEENDMMIDNGFGPFGRQILQLTYTKDEFSINQHYVVDKAEGFQEEGYCYSPNTELGFAAAFKNQSIFEVIKEEIVNSQWRFSSPGEPGTDPDIETYGAKGIDGIILSGESGQEELFLQCLKEALEEMGIPELYDEAVGRSGLNSTMGAARGAAELAERWVWKACEGKDETSGSSYLDEETAWAMEEEAKRAAKFEYLFSSPTPRGSGVGVGMKGEDIEDEENFSSGKMELV